MPTSIRETLLVRYHYDPLDRLVDCTPFEQSAIRRYYCKTRLATEIQGSVQRSIVQHDDQLLAQQQREGGKMAATLLATDQQRSVLNALDATQPHPLAYTPYGHRPMREWSTQLARVQRRTAGSGDRALSFGQWVSAVQPGVDAVQQPGQLESVWGRGVECICVLRRRLDKPE